MNLNRFTHHYQTYFLLLVHRVRSQNNIIHAAYKLQYCLNHITSNDSYKHQYLLMGNLVGLEDMNSSNKEDTTDCSYETSHLSGEPPCEEYDYVRCQVWHFTKVLTVMLVIYTQYRANKSTLFSADPTLLLGKGSVGWCCSHSPN